LTFRLFGCFALLTTTFGRTSIVSDVLCFYVCVLSVTFAHSATITLSYFMALNNIHLISWNVRGLNAVACCLAVHEMIAATPL
jgi:hypothetical protein